MGKAVCRQAFPFLFILYLFFSVTGGRHCFCRAILFAKNYIKKYSIGDGMKKEMLKFRKKDILLIVVITVLLLPSMMTTISSSTEAEHLPHVWKDYKYSGLWSVAAKANDDDEMDESDTWDELRDFFSGCSTIDDFYDAIVDDIGQANNGIQSMVGLSNDLSDIVDAALEAKGEGDPDEHKLLCHQHAMLFAAGG